MTSNARVTGVLTQTKPGQRTVEPGNCKFGHCSAFTKKAGCPTGTWNYGTRSCAPTCPNQPRCSYPDERLFPQIGGHAANNIRFTGANRRSGIEVSGDYDVSQFKTKQDVDRFLSTFENNPQEQIDTHVIPVMCSKLYTKCSNDEPTCSGFFENGSIGSMCRSWVSRVGAGADSIKLNTCLAHPELKECRCILRQRDDVYNVALQALDQPIPDQLWYRPCRDTDLATQLIPSQMFDKSGVCPTSLCQIRQEYLDLTNVSLDDIQSTVICQTTTTTNDQSPNNPEKPITPKPPTNGTPTPTPTPGSNNDSKSTWQQIKDSRFFIPVIFVVGILLFLFVLLIVMRY